MHPHPRDAILACEMCGEDYEEDLFNLDQNVCAECADELEEEGD